MERRSATGAEGTERTSRGLVLADKVPAIDDAQCASVSASKRSYYSCLSPRHHLWGGAHVAQAEGGPTYGNQGGEEARPVSELDLAKALNVGASAKPRSKGQVFGVIAQHVGVRRRDVVNVFDVMGSLIKASQWPDGALASLNHRATDDDN